MHFFHLKPLSLNHLLFHQYPEQSITPGLAYPGFMEKEANESECHIQ